MDPTNTTTTQPLNSQPSYLAPAMAAGGDIANSYLNYLFQKKFNKEAREYNDAVYSKTLADNRANWELANAYNSPEQQMQRLREAGLNPNLVYGKGADNTAASISGGDQGKQNMTAPRLDNKMFGHALGNFVDFQQRRAQTDNLYAQNALLRKDALLKDAQIITEVTKGQRGKFDLEFAQDARESLLMKIEAEAGLKYGEFDWFVKTWDKRMEMLFTEASQRKLTAEQTRNLIELQNYEIELSREGLQRNDPTFWRALHAQAKKLGLLDLIR